MVCLPTTDVCHRTMDSPLRTNLNQRRGSLPTSPVSASSGVLPVNPYPPYPPTSPTKTHGTQVDRLSYSEPTHDESGQAHVGSEREWPIANVYWGVSGIFGFKERWSLTLCEFGRGTRIMICSNCALRVQVVIFGGALLAFSLARAEFFSVKRLPELMIPGKRLLTSKTV